MLTSPQVSRIVYVSLFFFQTQALGAGHFFGEDATSGPDGRPYQTTAKLLKRELDPSKNLIREEVHFQISKGGPFQSDTVTLKVTGQTFRFEAGSGAYTGQGSFFGQSWAWSGWTSTANLPDGASVRVLDHLEGDTLQAVSEYRDGEGSFVSVTKTLLKRTDSATYESLRRSLLP